MELSKKIEILAESARYDVACTSSGSKRSGVKGQLGNTYNAGICHSFAGDGRCISLLKVLFTNYCIYDCQYCVNRRSNDLPRASFSPRELADLTMEFYRRNYIEGLFLSSGVIRSPDYTMELIAKTLHILRNEYHFNGYIHAKAIPGASKEMISLVGSLVDRISVNLELPSEQSLNLFAPDKAKHNILLPMGEITRHIDENKQELALYKHTPSFAPAGQSTQMIIGASPETDFQIIRLSQSLYKKYQLRRVFYSAYLPVGTNPLLPQDQPVPLLREHRLYQADWLLRFYGFQAEEILGEDTPNLDPYLDPKCSWALRNLKQFPVEINQADYYTLLRVPGIGPTMAKKIVAARKMSTLRFEDLKKMRVLLKRAVYFITCSGKHMEGVRFDPRFIYDNLVADTRRNDHSLPSDSTVEQASFYDSLSIAN